VRSSRALEARACEAWPWAAARAANGPAARARDVPLADEVAVAAAGVCDRNAAHDRERARFAPALEYPDHLAVAHTTRASAAGHA